MNKLPYERLPNKTRRRNEDWKSPLEYHSNNCHRQDHDEP